MLNSTSIVQLYNRVLESDMMRYSISEDAIRIGIKSMKEVYKPGTNKQSASRSTVADFNDAAFRCAYLHKYAALHTAMVRDMLYEAVNQNYRFFYDLVHCRESFKICSLGGGPGTDVIGVLSALHTTFSFFPADVTVVDYMVNWSYSFGSIINELGSGYYGAFGNNTSQFLQWRYVGANLLKPSSEVVAEISDASLVTMIKFVSAASCKDTERMVKNIFTSMRPGALLFFIDNDGGGFREMIIRAAQKYNFISVFGPFQHENYTNELVKVARFGAVSCHKTTVSIHILQKPAAIVPYARMPRVYCDPYSEHPTRTVILESPYGNRPALLETPSFPVTPLPYDRYNLSRGEINNNFISPIQSTPLTPCIYQLDNSEMPTPTGREFLNSPVNPYTGEFLNSPVNLYTGEVLNSPMNLYAGNRRRAIFSPDTPINRSRITPKRGCLPLPRFKRWRNNLSRKLNTVKSRARSVLRRKSKKKKGNSNEDSKK